MLFLSFRIYTVFSECILNFSFEGWGDCSVPNMHSLQEGELQFRPQNLSEKSPGVKMYAPSGRQ